jgi:mevalonate kinase
LLAKQTITVSVPGKMMLAGEYAVLRGGSALASSVSCGMTVRFKTEPEFATLTVRSAAWDKDVSMDQVPPHFADEPLIKAVQFAAAHYGITAGCFEIDAGIDPSFGAGSSSALRLGVLLAAAAQKQLGPVNEVDRWDIARQAWELQRQGQGGIASGYDIATQNLGALVCMRQESELAWPGMIVHLRHCTDWLNRYVHVYLGGRGAATATLSPQVNAWLDTSKRRDEFMNASEILVAHLTELATHNQSPCQPGFFADVAALRQILDASPAKHSHVSAINGFSQLDQSWTYKTTGAGGDDALLVFADADVCEHVVDPAMRGIGRYRAPWNFSTNRAEVRVL